MCEVWLEGEVVALEVNLCRSKVVCLHFLLDAKAFLSTKARLSQIGATSPLAAGAEKSDQPSQILKY
jgi:hypothetical protein